MKEIAGDSNTCTSVVRDICSLFTILQNVKSKKTILNKLTELFLLLYNERMKRKLLYDSTVANWSSTGSSCDEEDNTSLRRIFKTDLIILQKSRKNYTKYEQWLNECYEKFLNMLFQLLKHNDEVFVTKSLSLLFGSLQFESKIYDKIIREMEKKKSKIGNNNDTAFDNYASSDLYMNEGDDKVFPTQNNQRTFIESNKRQNNSRKAFPIKLFRKIIFQLLRIDNISVSTMKYICKSYLCFYYDLNYYFLHILKTFCVLKKGIWNEKFYSDDDNVCYGEDLSKERENKKELEKNQGPRNCHEDILRDNPNTNLLIFSILINSIKPEKKIREVHIRNKDFLKRSRIDELCLDLNDEEVRMSKRKKRRIDRKKRENISYDKEEMKKTFHNYDTDDSIVHSSKEESTDGSSSDKNSETSENGIHEDSNFLQNANLMHQTNNSDAEYENILDEDQVKDYDVIKRRKSKLEFKMKNRKNNLFISANVEKRIYARLYSSCWFYFITTFNHKHSMILQLLHSIPICVFPYTNNPYYLIDFFNYSFYSSPSLYTSLASLPGIFYILTELNVGNLLDKEDTVNISSNVENAEADGVKKDDNQSEQEDIEKKNVQDENNSTDESEEGSNDLNSDDKGEKKLNDNMYTDYYKRLFELITPASFYYADTSFLKIIHVSIKNQMIPIHYIISFLKKLLRVACLTSYNISINILSVVYDLLICFKSELKDAMALSASVFMNIDIKKDFFCYENLNKNFDKNKIVEILRANAKILRDGGGGAWEVDQNDYVEKEKNFVHNLENVKREKDYHHQHQQQHQHCVVMTEAADKSLCVEIHRTEKDINIPQGLDMNVTNTFENDTQRGEDTNVSCSTKKLFSLQECLPNKYQINMNTLNRKELYMVNHIFYEIILLNNHLCDNLKYYSNVYHYNFNNDSSLKPHMLYTNPSKFNLEMEDSLLGFLKNFLSFKKKKETDILPSVEQKEFSTIFL
ncbi:hypothetical protein, conserved [Plasmodium gonderi]|uniref:CCAAT-binding factor domain-containing protein n=1 Tax=Plasmodium gonderi TaxID=77519 RepID=A0A1Y1JLF7_PLAGO|nr:hypothetical protein, conserved [Plasmodium gonderi]GAW83386.1 hypothetical protein, conserved [Plasmodium gonderi]